MIDVEIAFTNAGALALAQKQVEQLYKLLDTVLPESRTAHNDTTLAPYLVVPGGVIYPIQWKSVKQRRAFFATNGFGKGIPTKRSGTLQQAWVLTLQRGKDDATFTMVNNSGYEQYVTGMAQQPFHAVTGWFSSDTIGERQGAALATQVSTDIVQAWAAQK